MIVIDTSVFVDYLIISNVKRHNKARKIIDFLSNGNYIIYEPFLLEVELAAVLSRKLNPEKVSMLLRQIKRNIILLSEERLHTTAIKIALKVHPRVADAYFIATAKLTNSVLITNDKIMAGNTKKYGVESYYLLEEFDKAIERIKNMSSR